MGHTNGAILGETQQLVYTRSGRISAFCVDWTSAYLYCSGREHQRTFWILETEGALGSDDHDFRASRWKMSPMKSRRATQFNDDNAGLSTEYLGTDLGTLRCF
jgi:hypothetical protein